ADMLLQLYEATEPPKQEEIEIDIDLEKTAADKIARVSSTTANDKEEKETSALTDKIESLLKSLFKGNIEKLVVDRLKQKQGKVE
ncbi:unnamed protein product, partial [marine sediment metagenome]